MDPRHDPIPPPPGHPDEVRAVLELAELGERVDAGGLARIAAALTASARHAGARAVANGQWAADIAIEVASRLRFRDRETLEAQYGVWGPALAEQILKSAGRSSAALGAAGGAVMSASELAPPAWVSLPIEVVVETLAEVALEMKLIAELHEAMGFPIPGTGLDRGIALGKAWAERRGVSADLLASPVSISTALGHGARAEVVRLLRRRLVRRVGRSAWALTPLLIGAAAGAALNRRATLALGEEVIKDLRRRGPTVLPGEARRIR